MISSKDHKKLTATGLLAVAAVIAVLCTPAMAQAAFGVSEFDLTFNGPPPPGEKFEDSAEQGDTVTQAGAHPFAMTTSFHFNSKPNGKGGEYVEDAPKDIFITQIEGFVGNPTAVPPCASADFLTSVTSPAKFNVPDCPDSAAVGTAFVQLAGKEVTSSGEGFYGAVYNLVPPPGVAAKLGFWIAGTVVTVEVGVAESPPYNIVAATTGISQIVEVAGSVVTLWGNPADPAHDPLRGYCLNPGNGTSLDECPANISAVPFLTIPRACEGPLATSYAADSWQEEGAYLPDGQPDLADPAWKTGSSLTHDAAGSPQAMTGCGKLGFGPVSSARPSSLAASSPSGLDFALTADNEGLANPTGLSVADLSKAVVTLPRGMTINPSQAEGLETCTEAQLKAESPYLAPGEGPTYTPPSERCPEASKIGTVEVETPILEDQLLKGSVYVATPYENRFGTLIALYVVIRDPGLGIVLKLPLKVEPDPQSGQLVTTSEEIPPFPFSRFKLHLREGGRSPLITPPGCGSFETKALLYPSSGGAPTESTSSFEIVSGPNGGACPSGTAKFDPGFEAGTHNNAAGSYSPFDMRITRQDGEQDITKFSSVLPPGVVARLAGTSWCPEAGIAQAKGRTGENGGTDERNDPSCPATSQIGTTIAGAGAGGQLTYVGGHLYLAGPYNGAPLSVVAIVPAVAGPFDAGTVVVREALALNPVSGLAEVDGAASDPIPHILQGIPLNVRELQVHVDKPDFTLNATSCAEAQARATLWGGGTALAPLPDTPVDLSSRYQAASCASLAFKPRLAIKLFGGTRRGAFPALRAIVRPRPGQANFARAAVTLPRSAFLEQGHIRTICTRVQFAAGAGHGSQCPKGAVYGHAKAWSPLIEGPATGPVYLRSSNHNLPDLVVALKGPDSAPVDIELASRIDSVKGGIRGIFTGIPDLPVSRFVLAMQGGKKGLIVNSRNLCYKPARNKAKANLVGQNGRKLTTKPRVVSVTCQKRRKAKRKKAKRSAARPARASAPR